MRMTRCKRSAEPGWVLSLPGEAKKEALAAYPTFG